MGLDCGYVESAVSHKLFLTSFSRKIKKKAPSYNWAKGDKMNRILCASAVALLSMSSEQLQAAPIQWTLQNVTFDDGGTANGSFVYDADLGNGPTALSSISITTTSGSAFSGTSYTSAYFTSLPNWLAVTQGTHGLHMQFLSPLTNAGGTIALDLVYAGNQLQEFTVPGGVNLRAIASGSVASVVPVPAAAWLIGGALGALGWIRRRQATT
jgi:hypothetical protein